MNETKTAVKMSTQQKTKTTLKGLIKKRLAGYLESIGFHRTLKLSHAYLSKKQQVEWFGFRAPCPICQDENSTGYCMVGIQRNEPYAISFRCKRQDRAEKYIEIKKQENKKTGKEEQKSYVSVPMGKDDKGNNIFDTYVMTYQNGGESYWARDNKKSQSNFVTNLNHRIDYKEAKEYEAKQAPAAYKDIMYRFALAKYKLSSKHHQNLIRRGFTEEDLNTFPKGTGFGTYNWRVRQFNDSIYQRNHDAGFSIWERALKQNISTLVKLGVPKDHIKRLWYGVPGFYLKSLKQGKKSVRVPLLSAAVGMMVPYYNVNNQVVGFQIRYDEPPLKKVEVSKLDLEDFDVLKDGLNVEVNFPRSDNQRYYEVSVNQVAGDRKLVAKVTGYVHSLNSWIDVTNKLKEKGIDKHFKFQVKGKEDQKYCWISSSGKTNEEDGGIYGTGSGSPIEVAYQPKIAKLNPNSHELEQYRNKPKNVWLTEGGLKALLAVRKLTHHFTDAELDKYGHDILGAPGVGCTNDLIDVLKKLNVKNVTLAYDMDMFNNKTVMTRTFETAKQLIDAGYGVRIAIWNSNVGKGIDDILVSDNCYIDFKNLEII